METYLTADEVAVMVRMTVQTIRRYTMRNKIPFHKINRAVRYKKTEIEQWLEKREQEKAKAKKEEPQDGGLFSETETEAKHEGL